MVVNHKEQHLQEVEHGQDTALLQSPYVTGGPEGIEVINMQDPALDYTDLRKAKEHIIRKSPNNIRTRTKNTQEIQRQT